MLPAWCSNSHLNHNPRKSKEIIDIRKSKTTLHLGLTINEEEVKYVKDLKFLGLYITTQTLKKV